MPQNTFDFQKLIKNIFKELQDEKLIIIEKFFTNINFMNPRKIKKLLLRYSIVRNRLIEKKLLDENNEWNIIWVLFFIIENEFEEKNYFYMLKNNKKDILCSKLNFDRGNSSIKRIPGYNEYKLCVRVEKENETTYLPIDFLEFILNPEFGWERDME